MTSVLTAKEATKKGNSAPMTWPPTIFAPLNSHGIKRYHGLYILQGLSTSPCMYMKFNTQKKYPTNGNDAVYSIFGPGYKNRFKHSKDFLVQDS